MDWADDRAGHSSIGTSNHVALANIGAYNLCVIYGQPRAAAHPSLFRRTNRLIASWRGQPLLTSGSVHDSTRLALQPSFRPLLRQNVSSTAVVRQSGLILFNGKARSQLATSITENVPVKLSHDQTQGGCLSAEASRPR